MDNLNIIDLHARYMAGESFTALAPTAGVKKGDTIKAIFIKHGLPLRKVAAPNRHAINADQLLQMVNEPLSVNVIAKRLGVDRGVITRRLKELNITPRNRSEAMFLRMQQTTPQERQLLTRKANIAIRGKKRTFEDLCKRAVGKQNIKYASALELKIIQHLAHFRVETIPQKAIGPYNVDIALADNPIAVEVFGGNWHASGRAASRFRKRFDYLINAGWLPIIIWVTNSYPLSTRAAQKIISIMEESRHNQSMWGHEHVIGGNGEPCPIGQGKLDYRA